MDLSLVYIPPKQMRLSEVTHGLGEAARTGEETGPRPLCLGSHHGMWEQREAEVDAGVSTPPPDADTCSLIHSERLFSYRAFWLFF